MIKVIIGCCVLFFISCNTSNKKGIDTDVIADQKLNEATEVSVATLQQDRFMQQIISNGKIEAINKTELRFKMSERLASIRVKNGQEVAKGQIIATLDNAMLKNQLDRAQINFDKANNKLKEEEIRYGFKTTKNDETKSKILHTIKIQSGYYETENTLKRANILYEQTVLKAPYKGIIANLESKIGNFITSGDVFCFVIAEHQLEVVFPVLETELEFIHKNQEVTITTFANQDKTYNGFITEINPLVDDNGLIQVKAKIAFLEASLFDGMNVKIILNRVVKDIVVIPKEALVLRSNKEVVFTLENGVAKWNYVAVKDENSKSYAIEKGLQLGDTIIISGNLNLSHNSKVKITQ
ncbi:Multidrug resistance protein MdtA [Kordia antarctica]|uniref:Multidrug resistance protein MdtA n=1 Tax=Kordia antarctica TaxID=1218801 RepID=A0A7L4ZP76_9FLAO|nr:efflux RND transporter periplasmic adaptor subunit [Kordia antarctica]QHI38415.1 Multidrug resistance protein MdtA [Kordia antarctica]